MKDLAGFFPFASLILTFVILTVAEIFILKFSKQVDSPKFILYPVLANFVAMIAIVILTVVGIVFFAAGFIMAFSMGFDAGEKYFYIMLFAFISIPLLMFVVRVILFLLFKIGRFPFALIYSFLTTIVNLVVVIISTFISAEIYQRLTR